MLVLDANILVRAVPGSEFARFLKPASREFAFIAPDSAFAEAREHLPEILLKRNIHPESAIAVLDKLTILIGCINTDIRRRFEAISRKRLKKRDENDWPVLATALALECPIWTEDADFFGTGVATWRECPVDRRK
jgi:predicted nucleic acid-binding protein